ncbi:MAG TPA: cysteine desulfurase-like protein [Candidatus Limnocylindria bacterium]
MTTPVARTGLDVAAVRDHFPALARTLEGTPIAFLDGPGGTQVPVECIDAMTAYLRASNANHGGAFRTSEETDALLEDVHAAAADFLGTDDPGEVAFGPNMTTLTLAVSRAIGRDLGPGDEVVVSRLDHDANIAPWLAMAEDRDATVRWLDFDPADCTLRLDLLDSVIGERTRIVAVGLASNAVGTINDVRRIADAARAHGALLFVDAVHAAPHMPIDVAALGADLLACSPYKFFGPHLGVLWGRRELLERLRAYRVRPAGEALPGKWETGTQNHEALAGLMGTFEYLAALGRAFGGARPSDPRRAALRAAMEAIRSHERGLIGPLLEGLEAVPGCRVFGLTDPGRVDERVPTVSFTLDGVHPREVARRLGERAINVWDGDYYAVEVVRRLGLEESGGMVRAGLVHYNTVDEIQRLATAVGEIASGS